MHIEGKRNRCLGAISPLFHNILLHVPVVRFSCLNSDQVYLLRSKRVFDMSDFEITRVDCILIHSNLVFAICVDVSSTILS